MQSLKIYMQMQISLKKQIQKKKIDTLFKTYDVVFFFAILDLPQKNRQLLKKQIADLCPYPYLLLPSDSQERKVNTHSTFSSLNCKDFPSNKHNFSKTPFLVSGEKEQYILKNVEKPGYKRSIVSLHICNKSLKHLKTCSHLPLYGQTLLVACRHEKQAMHLYNTVKLLYKGFFLGGLYKGVFKTRTYLKALCDATSRKTELYTLLLKVLFATNYKSIRATATTYQKLFLLLKYRSKQR